MNSFPETFVFTQGANRSTGRPQQQMVIKGENGFEVVLIPDSASPVKSVILGAEYKGECGNVLTEGKAYMVVTVLVTELVREPVVEAATGLVVPKENLNPEFADDFKGPAHQPKGKTLRVTLVERDGFWGFKFVDGYNLRIKIDPTGFSPKNGERWEVLLGRKVKRIDLSTKVAEVGAVLMRRLPDISVTSEVEKKPIKIGGFSGQAEADQKLLALAAGHVVQPRKHKLTRSMLRATRDSRRREAEQKTKQKGQKKQKGGRQMATA